MLPDHLGCSAVSRRASTSGERERERAWELSRAKTRARRRVDRWQLTTRREDRESTSGGRRVACSTPIARRAVVAARQPTPWSRHRRRARKSWCAYRTPHWARACVCGCGRSPARSVSLVDAVRQHGARAAGALAVLADLGPALVRGARHHLARPSGRAGASTVLTRGERSREPHSWDSFDLVRCDHVMYHHQRVPVRPRSYHYMGATSRILISLVPGGRTACRRGPWRSRPGPCTGCRRRSPGS